MLDYRLTGLLEAIFTALQFPASWPAITSALGLALDHSKQGYIDLYKGIVPPEESEPAKDGYLSPGQSDLSGLAVSCADAPPYGDEKTWSTAKEMVDNLLAHTVNTTETFGAT
jgi:hypothetical protein